MLPDSHHVWHMYTHVHIYVPCNLGICAILESGNCAPISRLRTQSWDCAVRLRNLELTNRRELRTFRDGNALNVGTPQVWDLSAPVPRPRGREFLRVVELPRSLWCGGLSIHVRHWRWRQSCKSLLHTSLTFIYDGNSMGSIVHATEIALSRDCAPVPRDLEIAHWCCAISRLVRNFRILRLRKFPDCTEHMH